MKILHLSFILNSFLLSTFCMENQPSKLQSENNFNVERFFENFTNELMEFADILSIEKEFSGFFSKVYPR